MRRLSAILCLLIIACLAGCRSSEETRTNQQAAQTPAAPLTDANKVRVLSCEFVADKFLSANPGKLAFVNLTSAELEFMKQHFPAGVIRPYSDARLVKGSGVTDKKHGQPGCAIEPNIIYLERNDAQVTVVATEATLVVFNVKLKKDPEWRVENAGTSNLF